MSMNETLRFLSNDSNASTLVVENLFPKITLGVILSSLAIFTVGGNILVLYAIQTEKNLRTVSNLFILSLAFADLAVGLFVMPLSAATIIAGRWPFSSVICKMWLSIDYVASTASIFNLVLLSLDRYWAVVHPLRYLQKRTRRRATIFILTVWFVSSLWAPAVIFWSYIAPQHSDIIEKHECDTSFRSNKTFKTLTALGNFYVPLLTMIIISCRIMIAIRSRSKMELGRRLSATTQKRMRRDRSVTTVAQRPDNQLTVKPDDAHRRSSAGTIVANPLDSPTSKYAASVNSNRLPLIERGQCFCSTCQTYGGTDNDSLWELQDTPLEKTSSSSFTKRISFAQFKNISAIFSASHHAKETKKTATDDLLQTHADQGRMKRNSFSTSNDTKFPMVVDSSRCTSKNGSAKSIKIPPAPRTSSVTSSFSDDFPDVIYHNSKDKRHKTVTLKHIVVQASTTSNNSTSLQTYSEYPSMSVNSHPCLLKAPMQPEANEPITPMIDQSASKTSNVPSNSKMTFSTFLDNLINPSRSHSLQKELKAARQLGMLVGVFTVSWLPYFILFLVVAWCNHCVSNTVFTASIWLGYLNSTFNPLIYPLCNVHFRRAFQKICHCKHAKTKLPNLNALRELHALHTVGRRR